MLPIALAVGGCSLFHQDLPNEAPVLEVKDDALQTRRGGSVTLEAVASDEDDDPLLYRWVTRDGTLEPDGAEAEWVAPLQIEGASQVFTVFVTVLDRDCDIVVDPRDRDNCELSALASVDSFHIEVTQRPPRLLSATTADDASFRDPAIALTATAEDDDGDALEFVWSVDDPATATLVDSTGDRASFLPLFPGRHRVGVAVHDRADTATGTAVTEVPEPVVPDGGSVSLEMPGPGDTATHVFEIDVYEYPNRRGVEPVLVESYLEAARICSVDGARLCTVEEWSFACAGPEGRSFSSTDDPGGLPGRFGRRFCNTPGSVLNADVVEGDEGVVAAAGYFANCSGSAGVFDLTGNAREWLAGRDSTAWMARSSAALDGQCAAVDSVAAIAGAEDGGDAALFEPGSGFRCCRDP